MIGFGLLSYNITIAAPNLGRKVEFMALDPVIKGHPIHPAVIVLPAGLLPASYIFDVLAAVTNSDKMADAAFYNMLAGYAGSTVALTTGFLDYLQMAPDDPAKSMARTHGLMNAGLAAMYTVNLMARMKNHRSKLGFLISTVGTTALMVSAYLGGELAYGRGWRVRPLERFEMEFQKARKVGMFKPEGAAQKPQAEVYPPEVLEGFHQLKSGQPVLEEIKNNQTISSFEELNLEPATQKIEEPHQAKPASPSNRTNVNTPMTAEDIRINQDEG